MTTKASNAVEILQRAQIFKANYCLKVHNAHVKLVSPISGLGSKMWIVLGDGWWTADGYVIIIVYLHKIPVYSAPRTLPIA